MKKFKKIKGWLYYKIKNLTQKIYDLYFNPIVRTQLKDSKEVPIIIINFNQLFYLKQLVDFLIHRGFKNIVIVDNNSSYPPLLEYYKEIESIVKIESMDHNYGHMVFFENKELLNKYAKGFYVVTDADIVPNQNLPDNFLKKLISHLIKNWNIITKVGFALSIDDIPDVNTQKEKILKWEKEFWRKKIDENIYDAFIDTTFALYKPGYPVRYDDNMFYKAHRLAGDYTAKHGGWYINQNELNKEQEFYINSASKSSSWLNKNHDKIWNKK